MSYRTRNNTLERHSQSMNDSKRLKHDQHVNALENPRKINRQIKISRPPNAFLVYANENRKILAENHSMVSNKVISTMLGQRWKSLDDSEKAVYYEKAKILDKQHKQKYPDYVYNPQEARLRKLLRTSSKKVKEELSECSEKDEDYTCSSVDRKAKRRHSLRRLIKKDGLYEPPQCTKKDEFIEKECEKNFKWEENITLGISQYIPNNPSLWDFENPFGDHEEILILQSFLQSLDKSSTSSSRAIHSTCKSCADVHENSCYTEPSRCPTTGRLDPLESAILNLFESDYEETYDLAYLTNCQDQYMCQIKNFSPYNDKLFTSNAYEILHAPLNATSPHKHSDLELKNQEHYEILLNQRTREFHIHEESDDISQKFELEGKSVDSNVIQWSEPPSDYIMGFALGVLDDSVLEIEKTKLSSETSDQDTISRNDMESPDHPTAIADNEINKIGSPYAVIELDVSDEASESVGCLSINVRVLDCED